MAKAPKAAEQGRWVRTEIENSIDPNEVSSGYYARGTMTVKVAVSRWEWTYDMDAVHPEHYETEGEYPKGSSSSYRSDNSAPIVEHYATYEAQTVEEGQYGSIYTDWKRSDRPESAKVRYPNYRSNWSDWQQERVGGIDKAEAWLNRTYRFVEASAPLAVRQARAVAAAAAQTAEYEENYAQQRAEREVQWADTRVERAEQAVKDALAALEQAKVEAAKARQDVAKVAQTIAAAKVEAAAAARKAEMVAAEVAA